jgi:hypothetical protein
MLIMRPPMGHFFASQRLIARRFEPRDLAGFVAMRADPEVARFQSWENFTEDDGHAFLEGLALRNPGAGLVSVRAGTQGEPRVCR